MALILNHFYSSALTECNSMTVIATVETWPDRKFPVLWLLPPVGMDHTAWQRHTWIEEMAEKKGILVVMPDMKLSYGLDMKYGFAYEKMLTQELPELIADYFPVDLNNQMIIGVKEGGYAALRAAFRHPKQYQMAASYSCGSLTEERVPEELHKQVENAFGTWKLEELRGTEYDLNTLFENLPLEKHGEISLKICLEYSKEDTYAASAGILAEKLKHSPVVKQRIRVSEHEMNWKQWMDALEREEIG